MRNSKCAKKWFADGIIPENLITDNGREFINEDMTKMCKEYGIKHTRVSVESHRSNGRVERVIGSLRESLKKLRGGKLEERVIDVVNAYNNTYHSSIKCTPYEAFDDYMNVELGNLNNDEGKWRSKKRRYKVDNFRKGDKIRLSQKENIAKHKKGRFYEMGTVMHDYKNGSLLVKNARNGRMSKRKISDVKRICNGKLDASGGDVDTHNVE